MSRPTEVYGRPPAAVAAVVDGETVVLSPADLRYHSLNVTAAAVWDCWPADVGAGAG